MGINNDETLRRAFAVSLARALLELEEAKSTARQAKELEPPDRKAVQASERAVELAGDKVDQLKEEIRYFEQVVRERQVLEEAVRAASEAAEAAHEALVTMGRTRGPDHSLTAAAHETVRRADSEVEAAEAALAHFKTSPS